MRIYLIKTFKPPWLKLASSNSSQALSNPIRSQNSMDGDDCD